MNATPPSWVTLGARLLLLLVLAQASAVATLAGRHGQDWRWSDVAARSMCRQEQR